MLKKVLLATLIVVFTIVGTISGEHSVDAAKAPEGNIQGKPKISQIDTKKYIDSKYVITPEFDTKRTKFIMTGNGYTRRTQKNSVYATNIKNDFSITGTYTNVATYKGRDLDLEFKILSGARRGFKGGHYVFFDTDKIGFAQAGYNHINMNVRYKYKDGKYANDVPGSYLNVTDIDVKQSLRFNDDQYKTIDRMYVYNNTRLSYWTSATGRFYGATFWDNLQPTNTRARLLLLVDGNLMRFGWTRTWEETLFFPDHHPHGIKLADYTLRWEKEDYNQYFMYTPTKPMATKPVIPEKFIHVNGKDVKSNTVNDLTSTINYRVYHDVPTDAATFYYKNYTFKDQLDKALKVDPSKVKIYRLENGEEKNETKNFTVSVSKNNLLTIKANNSKRAGFHGKYYRFDIPATLNDEGVGLEELYSKGTQKIKNKAEIDIQSVTKGTYKSNEVTTTINAPKLTEPTKSLSDSKVTDVTSNKLEPLNDTITYKVTHNVPAGYKYLKFKNYSFTDQIDEKWRIEDVKVINGNNGKETKKFEIDVEDNKIVATAKPEELKDNGFYGKDYILEVKVKLLEIDKLYPKVNGEIEFKNKNIAKINVNGKDYESNEVETRVEIPYSEELKKNIEIIKEWKNDTKYDRPDSITVELYQDGKKIDEAQITESNGWKHQFKNLDYYDNHWNEYEYTIKEVNVRGYESNITETKKGYLITNNLTYDPPTIPKLSKKVEGKTHLDVSIGDTYTYNLDYDVPKDLLGYKELILTDNLDNRLIVKDTRVVVDGKSIGKATVKGNVVSRVFDREILEEYKGKKINLEIDAEIKDGTKIELIDNIGDIQLNNKPKVNSNKVTVKPKPIQVGFEKIQIFTAKKDEGLPVKIDFNVKDYNKNYLENTFKVDILQKGTNKVVTTTNVKVKDIDKTLNVKIPSASLTKGKKSNYEAKITSSNEELIKPAKDMGVINTDGYVAGEETMKVELTKEDGTDNVGKLQEQGNAVDVDGQTVVVENGKYVIKNVIKTEREIHKDMKLFYEQITLPLKKLGKEKTGYGIEYDRDIEYTNDFVTSEDKAMVNYLEDLDAKLYVSEKLDKTSKYGADESTRYKDSFVVYPKEDGYTVRDLEIGKTTETVNNKGVEKYNIKLPKLYVERNTGYIFDDNTDYRITQGYRDGGRKIYIPIWLEELGKYDVVLKSEGSVGVHNVGFEVLDRIDVEAYMFAYVNSDTIQKDEILLRPVNYKGSGTLPEGWTDEDRDWFNKDLTR